jgi:pilus assembly protein CpaE
MARILVIDDNSEMLEMLRMILHHQGDHDVILSAEAQQGLETAKSYTPDIAIVDVMMPGMSGYEVVRRLRANPATADMGIIILTARGQPVDRQAAMDAGANYYMSKPVDAKELLAEIKKLVSVAESKSKSTMFPVFSLRGGIGCTTIAVNLALLLQQVGPTALLDLSTNSGHCALYLGMKSSRHWGVLLEEADLSNATTIGGLTLKHASGLRLLAAPPTPMSDGGFDSEQVELLINVFRHYMRFIVIDMPPTLTGMAHKVLEDARRIVLVSGNDSPGIQTTLQTLKVLDKHREKISLLINNPTPGRRPPMEALQRALRTSISTQIPYDAKQSEAKNSASPSVLSQPKSPMVAHLQNLTRQLLK